MAKALFPVQISTGIFFAFILSLPIQLGFHFWPDFAYVLGIRVDYLSPTVYLTDILAIALILLFFKFNLKKSFWVWFFQLFLYLLATSLLLSQNQGAALYKLAKVVELAFLGIALYQSPVFNKKHLKVGLSISIITTSLLSLVQFLKGGSIGLWILGERAFNSATPGISTFQVFGQEFLRPYATFSHPNSMAGFMLVSLLLLFPWKDRLGKAALILGLLAIILSWSQTVWLVLGVFMVWLAFKYLRKYTILLVILLSASPLFLGQLSDSMDVQARKGLLEASLQLFGLIPLLGVGLNNFVSRLPGILSPSEVWVLQPVHNIYLLVLIEIGLIGSVLALWGLRFLNLKRLTSNFPLWAILLTGSLDHYWITLQQNQLLFVITLVYLLKAKVR